MEESVDERYSVALNPSDIDRALPKLAYQRYLKLICRQCTYVYHIQPLGQWHVESYPSSSLALVQAVGSDPDNSDATIQTTSVGGFVVPGSASPQAADHELSPHEPEPAHFIVGEVGLSKAVDERREELKKKFPIVDTPRRWAVYAVRPNHPPTIVARLQDPAILTLACKKRYAGYQLNHALSQPMIGLLTGAGFSASLSFPTMRDFRSRLPDFVIKTLSDWLVDHPTLVDRATQDFEILLDLLLRLQRIAAISSDDKGFREKLRQLPWELESLFVFRETSDAVCYYPPLAHIELPNVPGRNYQSPFFQTVRKMLYEVTKAMVVATCHVRNDRVGQGVAAYVPFLDTLSRLNRGPLPIFTTNYDLAIEQLFAAAGRAQEVVGGMVEETTPVVLTRRIAGELQPLLLTDFVRVVSERAYAALEGRRIAVFHLHGCSNWFVERTTGRCVAFQADSEESLDRAFRVFWHAREPWVPGVIAPATVKDAYSISPPFNLGYDYLGETLRTARLLVVIGQALRDETLKEMLAWSVDANPGLQYVVVGFGDEASPHITDCIPSGRLTYFPGGFPAEADRVVQRCRAVVKSA